MLQFIDFSWNEYTGSLWIDELFGGLCCLCLCLCASMYRDPPHLSVCSLLLPLFFLSLFPFFVCPPSVFWPGSRRGTGSGWGPSFETGFKHSSKGVVMRVEEVHGGDSYVCVCVCVLRGSHVEAEGKYCYGHCCWGLPLQGLKVNRRVGWWELPRLQQARVMASGFRVGGEEDEDWLRWGKWCRYGEQKEKRSWGRMCYKVRWFLYLERCWFRAPLTPWAPGATHNIVSVFLRKNCTTHYIFYKMSCMSSCQSKTYDVTSTVINTDCDQNIMQRQGFLVFLRGLKSHLPHS